MALLSWLRTICTTTITVVTYLGGFSRFTHGRFTPRFYAYQLDRAPDDASTRAVPYIDITLATLTVVDVTRPYALLACAAFQGIGLLLRAREGKNPAPDLVLCSMAAVACWGSFASW